jgi:hypothetical protein
MTFGTTAFGITAELKLTRIGLVLQFSHYAESLNTDFGYAEGHFNKDVIIDTLRVFLC